jgi:hypothetical protein
MRRWELLLMAGMLGMAGPSLRAQTDAMIKVAWQVSLPVDLPPGAGYLCRARILWATGVDPGRGNAQSATSAGEQNGQVVQCAVEVPVWCNARRASGAAWLSTEVDALEPEASGFRLLRLAAETVPLRPRDVPVTPAVLPH